MARDEQAMTASERLVRRWIEGPLEAMPPNILLSVAQRLKADNERLRAREAALVAVVRQVAQPPSFVPLVPVYVTPEAFQQARALVASAAQEGEA